MLEKDKIILIGAGGHCRSVIDVIEWGEKYEIFGILDTTVRGKVGKHLILGNDKLMDDLVSVYNYVFISVGNIQRRIAIYEMLKIYPWLNFPALISPFATVSLSSKIHPGIFIGHQAVVNSGVVLHGHCIINTGAIIEHGVEIEPFCHIAPGAVVLGDCRIGTGTFIGAGATIKQGSIVPPNSFIKKGFDYEI